jgi:hypothetical protein
MSNFNRFPATTANNSKYMQFGWDFLFPRWGAPLQRPRSRGSPSPRDIKFSVEKLEIHRYHSVKTRSVYLISALLGTGT